MRSILHRILLTSLGCLLAFCSTWSPADAQTVIDAVQDVNRIARPSTSEDSPRRSATPARGGVSRTFSIDPRWENCQFPEHAVCFQDPATIATIYADSQGSSGISKSFKNPSDGSLRIVGTGHSFMAPGYQSLPLIAKAAGLQRPSMVTHTGGGMTGSARYKWEQENGIFGFDGNPKPLLLSAISNAGWDVMMWGPYYNDREEYYRCWIDFCLKYNPDMKFYLSDAWPQLEQLSPRPKSESELTVDVMKKMEQEKRTTFLGHFEKLRRRYPGRVFVLPTSKAMVIAVDYFHRGQLPGVEGIHQVIGGKKRSLWRDRLGHLGRGMESLEGYVFFASLYGRSPELIKGALPTAKPGGYPSPALDLAFRKIAWEAVISDPLSGVVDRDGDQLDDHRATSPPSPAATTRTAGPLPPNVKP